MAPGAAFQHAELVEQKVGVVAGAVETPAPGPTLLFAMGGANRAVYVQLDVLQFASPKNAAGRFKNVDRKRH